MEPGAFRVLVRSFQSVAWASWSYHSGCTLRALQLAGSRSGGAAWTRVARPGFAAPSRWPGTSCPPPTPRPLLLWPRVGQTHDEGKAKAVHAAEKDVLRLGNALLPTKPAGCLPQPP